MSDESTFRQKAREAIQAGKLPNRRPERTWGGRGAGADCTICGERVKHDEVELELEFAQGNDDSCRANYHLHIRCFEAWEFERESERQSLSSRVLPAARDAGTMVACEREATYRRGPA